MLPDVTFDSEMTIRLGGREARLAYLGPGQQAGDTFVFFPHARMVFTTGMFGPRSMPNLAFTPSVENSIKLLDQLAAMDVDKICRRTATCRRARTSRNCPRCSRTSTRQ